MKKLERLDLGAIDWLPQGYCLRHGWKDKQPPNYMVYRIKPGYQTPRPDGRFVDSGTFKELRDRWSLIGGQEK